jgi:hypothetical protein
LSEAEGRQVQERDRSRRETGPGERQVQERDGSTEVVLSVQGRRLDKFSTCQVDFFYFENKLLPSHLWFKRFQKPSREQRQTAELQKQIPS